MTSDETPAGSDAIAPSKQSVHLHIAVVAYTEYAADPRVRNETEILAGEGHELQVIAAQTNGQVTPYRMAGVELHRLPLSIRRGGKGRYLFQYATFLLMSSALLFKMELRHHFDYVHVHSLPDFQVFCALPAKLRGTRVVLDMHEAMPEIMAARFAVSPGSLWYRLATVLEAVSCRFADSVIVANDGIGGAVASRGHGHGDFVAVYNAGDQRIQDGLIENVRDVLGVPSRPLIVHAGAINKERDIETLIRAFGEVPIDLDVCLVLAGAGEETYVRELQGLCESLGLSDRVFFVGNLERNVALALMKESIVGLVTLEKNPLTELAWPTRVVEFAKLDKPLLVPSLRFIQQMLGDTAIYYNPGDAASLSAGLTLVLRNPNERRVQVERAAVRCEQFDSTQMKRRLLSVYRANAMSRQSRV